MTPLPQTSQPKESTRIFMIWLVAVVLLLDLFVVALALTSLIQSRNQYKERAAVQTQNLSQALEFSMAGIMDTADVALLSVVDEVERGLLRGSIDARSINAVISRQHARVPELDSLRFADARGTIVYGIGVAPGSSASVADRDYFKELRDHPKSGLVISKPVIGRISGKWVIMLARRVNNPDGSFAGVVYGPIALERVRTILSTIDVGPRGRIVLRDSEMGTIVRQPQRGDIAKEIGRKPMSSEYRRRIAAGETSATFYASTSSDNTARVVSYRKIGNYPLYLSVSLADDDYLIPWHRDLGRMAALVACFLLATLLLSRLVYVRWRREKQAEEALRKSKEELELRVTERTAELFQANARLTTELAERQRAEERLRQGRNMLAQIVDTIPQSVFWKDRDSVYLGCNIVFANLAGIRHPRDIVGKTDFDLPWLAEESQAYRRDDRIVMESNRPKYHIIEQQQPAQGARLWVDTTKVPLCNEKGEVYGVLGVYENITERKAVEDSRNKALALIESLLACSPTGILVYDGESGDCVMANKAVADMVGGSVEQLRTQNFRALDSWHEAGLDLIADEVLRSSTTRRIEKSFHTTFKKQVVLDCFFSRFEVDGVPHLMLITVDISDKKRLEQEKQLMEAQMLHVQKLESLGILAGGIAHDFNNILMVVIGNADLALMRVEPESPARENLVQIENAASRAADLARQMLAYSGKGHFVIENLDLNSIVAEMGQMLEVSISKKVTLNYDFAPELPAISGDATQLRQVILNLVINASEAIGDDPGTLTVRTSCRDCDRAYLSDIWIDEGLPEGPYLVLEVADTGCGIEPEIIPKIFDPFFTTKFTGRGLGMAAVLGIVRGHRGAIKIDSTIGEGTTFKLLFPAVGGSADPKAAVPAAAQDAWQGQGTVLLVDDEESIRGVGQDMLQELGFSVLTAKDGLEGIEVFSRHRDEIVCVLLDLTMPRMDGEQTFRELRRLKPDLRVVISSGYSEQEVTGKFIGEGVAGFINKPYKYAEVSKKLQEILEQVG